MLNRADYISHYGLLNDNLSYFSFVTLTTLGYGDIVPVSGPAKTFSTLEAIVGQLYIALLVARLVGLHTAQSIANKGRAKIVADECRPFLERDQGESQKEK